MGDRSFHSLGSCGGECFRFSYILFDTNGYNSGGDNGDTIMGRAYNFNGGTVSVNHGYGLVTDFVGTAPAVLIPGAMLLFAPGLVGLAAMRRRFKKWTLSTKRHGQGRHVVLPLFLLLFSRLPFQSGHSRNKT